MYLKAVPMLGCLNYSVDGPVFVYLSASLVRVPRIRPY